MKVGDKFPVSIAGHKIADAEVREVGEGTVTLIVPGTLVTMSTRTEIAPEAPEEKVETGSDHQILGVERDGVAVEEAPVVEQPAPVGETQEITTSEQVSSEPNEPVNQDSSTD